MSGENAAVAELRETARRVEEIRCSRGWSKSELCRRFAGLGSTKTYQRILDEDDDLAEGLKVDRQQENYREALMLIEGTDSEEIAEPLYEDFEDMKRAQTTVRLAMKDRGNTRLVIIEGNPGAGKTAICEMLEGKWSNVVVRSEVTEIWKDSPMTMLRAILLGIGKREARKKEDSDRASAEVNMPHDADGRQSKVIEQLNEQRLILMLDEAHHLGPRTLNLVKTLINQTPSVVVMLAIPTLLRRLESKAYEEARQLTLNRLFARIRLGSPLSGEALELLRRRGISFASAEEKNKIGIKLEEVAAARGQWKFVVLMARKLRELFQGNQIDFPKFIKALAAVEKVR